MVLPSLSSSLLFWFFIFWPHHAACRILVPWPGIEPTPSAVKVWSPNHWTSREFPVFIFKMTGLSSWSLSLLQLKYSRILNLVEYSLWGLRFSSPEILLLNNPKPSFSPNTNRTNYIYQGSGDSKQDDTHKAHLIPSIKSNEQ